MKKILCIIAIIIATILDSGATDRAPILIGASSSETSTPSFTLQSGTISPEEAYNRIFAAEEDEEEKQKIADERFKEFVKNREDLYARYVPIRSDVWSKVKEPGDETRDLEKSMKRKKMKMLR